MTGESTQPAPILISEFAEELHGRNIELVDREDRGSPLPAYAQAHRRLFRQFQESIRLITEMESARQSEEWGSCRSNLPQRSADAAQDLIYRATELFDLYLNDLPYFLGLNSKSAAVSQYAKDVRNLRSYWATICNRCKHNHRFLLPLEVSYSMNEVVTGFSVYGRTKDHLSPDDTIHHGVDGVSYNWMFRRLLASVVVADIAVGALIKSLPDLPTAEPLKTGSYELPYALLVEKVAGRSVLGMPGELRGPQISLSEEALNIAADKVLDPDRRAGVLRMWIDFFGASIAFRAPYSRGAVQANLGPPEGPRRPLGGFMRIEIANHSVSAPEEQ